MAKRTQRRIVKRSSRKSRVPRLMSNSLVLTRQFQADVARVAADTGLYRTFQLSQFVPSDFVDTYQHYRFLKIKLEYQLYNQLNNNSVFPTLYTSPQSWGELAVPTSQVEVAQWNNVQTFQFGPSRPCVSYVYTPYVNMVATGPGRNPVASPWLATTGTSVQHMTNVDWLQNYNSTSAATHTVRLVVTATIELRGTR